MSDREKLSDLLYEVSRKADEERYIFDQMADYLIANGVTVQEWISVVERLPELGVRVLIFDSYQGISIGKALWVASPSMRRIELVAEEDAIDYTEITHWMPLPQPPKP